MVPASAMRKANSASDGIVWMTPSTPRIGCAAPGSLAAATPSGMASAMAAARDTAARASEEFRGLGEALAFQLGRGVHADHQPRVDASLELPERLPGLRKALRHVGPVEQHGVIAGKELPVVLEQAQAIALDL